MSQPVTQEQLIQRLCQAGEAMKERLLVLVEAGEETGCQMRLEKDAIEAWEDVFGNPNFVWQTGIWHEALFWKLEAGKPVFTTDGITEIKDCDWKYRE